jgi:hypothetical protein
MYKMILLTFFISLFLSTLTEADVLEKESYTYKVKLISIKECTDCDKATKITLKIINKNLINEKEIMFESMTTKINNLYILNNHRVIVHGELDSAGEILTLVDIITGKILDTIWGGFVSFSKDITMMASKFRYPPTGLPLFYSDVLLVYDFSKSPLENAMDKSSIDDPEQRGFILYPDQNRKNKEYYYIAKNENEQHRFTSPLVWDNNKIYFLDSIGEKTYLVTVDISTGLSNPITNIQELDKELFYEEQYRKQADKETAKAKLIADELRLTDDGKFLEIKPFAHGPFHGKRVKIKIMKYSKDSKG